MSRLAAFEEGRDKGRAGGREVHGSFWLSLVVWLPWPCPDPALTSAADSLQLVA